jgi:hypothetical protein
MQTIYQYLSYFYSFYVYICTMKTISFEVNDELADKFNKMSKEKRDTLLKILLDRITSTTSLSDVLKFSALQAEQQGMTEEKLNELLKEE